MAQQPFGRSVFRGALAVLLSFSLTNLTAGVPLSPAALPAPQGNTAVAKAAGTASLNFPPAQGDQVTLQCDQLADNPSDPHRVGDGVSFSQMQADQATSVCGQAASRGARYQYLYGRALAKARRYDEAAAQYARADQAGYGLASFALARQYRDGIGVTADGETAVRYYYRAGTAGIAEAYADGGQMFFYEKPPNYMEAKSWFEEAAKGGSGEGYADLGWLYQFGYGVTVNLPQSFSLYSQAAKLGNDEGIFRVGLAYRDGIGVDKNPAVGCQWLIKAANNRHPYAEQEAARCYYSGTGVDQDREAAFNLFVKAGQAKLIDSRVIVADMLESGDGHDQDSEGAVVWYRAAAEQGDAYAMTQLGVHLRLGKGVAWSESEAMQWFTKAANMGDVQAEESLGYGYMNGLGQDAGQGRQDYQQAAYWFGKAAQQGDGYAQLNLGVMYEKGWGVTQDLEHAKGLYAQAAASDDKQIADLGREYFSNVPEAAAPEQTPQRTAVSSSKDSSDMWAAIVLGGLAIGAIALLSGGSSTSSSSGGSDYNYNYNASIPTDSGFDWPSSSSSDIEPMQSSPTAVLQSDPVHTYNGDLSRSDIIWQQ